MTSPSDPSPPKLWTPFAGLAGYFFATNVLVAVALAGWVVVRRPSWSGDLEVILDPNRLQDNLESLLVHPLLMGFMLAVSCTMFVLMTWLMALANKRSLGPLLLWPASRPLSMHVACLVGVLAVGSGFDAVLQLAHIDRGETLTRFADATRAASTGEYAVLVVLVALAGGSEELFFRGFMQNTFRAHWGRWRAAVVAAAIFGVMHMNLVHSSFAFLVGLFIGWSYERLRALRPVLFAHMANNALSFMGSRHFPYEQSATANATLLAGAVVALALSVLWIQRGTAAPT